MNPTKPAQRQNGCGLRGLSHCYADATAEWEAIEAMRVLSILAGEVLLVVRFAEADSPIQVKFCDLAHDPSRFDNRRVSLTALVATGFETGSTSTFRQSSRAPPAALVWRW